MANEEFKIVELSSDFYRDGITKIIAIIASVFIAIILIASLFFYLYLNKPKPITFHVDNEWRVKAPVPLSEEYLSAPDMLQWVGDAVRKLFTIDYYHYDKQVKNAGQYLTDNGSKVFLNQLNSYANYNTVQMNKLFINATPAFAPTILQKGLLGERYAWWVSLPINLNYIGASQTTTRYLELQILVVRVSTLTNLNGVAIDNIIVEKSSS